MISRENKGTCRFNYTTALMLQWCFFCLPCRRPIFDSQPDFQVLAGKLSSTAKRSQNRQAAAGVLAVISHLLLLQMPVSSLLFCLLALRCKLIHSMNSRHSPYTGCLSVINPPTLSLSSETICSRIESPGTSALETGC